MIDQSVRLLVGHHADWPLNGFLKELPRPRYLTALARFDKVPAVLIFCLEEVPMSFWKRVHEILKDECGEFYCGLAPDMCVVKIRDALRGAAANAREKIKKALLEAAKPLLESAENDKLSFCVRNQHGSSACLDLPAVIIPRNFDAPFLPRDVLTSDGVFHCDRCDCQGFPFLFSGRHLSFQSMREYSPEEYMRCAETLLCGISRLKEEKAVSAFARSNYSG